MLDGLIKKALLHKLYIKANSVSKSYITAANGELLLTRYWHHLHR